MLDAPELAVRVQDCASGASKRLPSNHLDPQSGRFRWLEPEITYYRRVRECGACGVIFETAEVDERVLARLTAFDQQVPDARREGATASAHLEVTRGSLDRFREAVDTEVEEV